MAARCDQRTSVIWEVAKQIKQRVKTWWHSSWINIVFRNLTSGGRLAAVLLGKSITMSATLCTYKHQSKLPNYEMQILEQFNNGTIEALQPIDA